MSESERQLPATLYYDGGTKGLPPLSLSFFLPFPFHARKRKRKEGRTTFHLALTSD